jgi:hypothetical protein
METLKRNSALVVLMSILTFSGLAQAKQKHEAAVVFGLNQPALLGGFNFELNYFTKKISFDFSHGVNLNYKDGLLSGAMKDQHLVAHLPFSTGFGVGYRFTEWINLRIEPKWHSFDIYYEGETQTAGNRLVNYTTSTLGLGLYGKWHPFKNQNSFLRGIMIAPSVRFWPNISSSLGNNQFIYENRITGRQETHKALNIGANNTPWFINVSVGYKFSW